ncbi:MAG: Gfo/Idh/MocA family oxidoreductase, partial [Chitinophagaceae bacterium]
MEKSKINVAIIGLGFGAEFIPIYQRHPGANMYAICQRNPDKLKEIGDAFGIEKRYTDYDELLKDKNVDAVHINTPIQNHAEQSIKALRAGKHVACTVPMATSVEDCKKIVEAVKETGLTYMMMETVVYSREFLFVKEMYENGELGKLQFLRASHQQEMAGWPGYWEGLPPMHYATHCVGPVVALA